MGELIGDFREAFHTMEVARGGTEHIRPYPCNVSTITLTGKLDRPMPVEEMRMGMELLRDMEDMGTAAGDDDVVETVNPAAAEEFILDDQVARTKRKRTAAPSNKGNSRAFHNQLPLLRGGKSVKVFNNGSVQMTGCTSPVEFLEAMQALCDYLPSIAPDLDGMHLVSFDTHMVNAVFLLAGPSGRPITIKPNALRDALVAAGVQARFEAEQHPSVIIPLKTAADGKRRVSIMVFQTGSVSLNGAKGATHVAAAYALVCQLLDGPGRAAWTEDPERTPPRQTTAKQRFDLVHGYPQAQYCACGCH